MVCASASRGTTRRWVLAGRPHGSQRGCGGASPTQSCLRGQASVRTGRTRAASGRRLAVRGRGGDAEREARAGDRNEGRREKQKTWDRQPTGRSGHGRNEFLHLEAGWHRRTPHGRAIACDDRSSRHQDSNRAGRHSSWSRRIAQPFDTGRTGPPAWRRKTSLRGRGTAAKLFPHPSWNCTSRADPRGKSESRRAGAKNPLAADGRGTSSWLRNHGALPAPHGRVFQLAIFARRGRHAASSRPGRSNPINLGMFGGRSKFLAKRPVCPPRRPMIQFSGPFSRPDGPA